MINDMKQKVMEILLILFVLVCSYQPSVLAKPTTDRHKLTYEYLDQFSGTEFKIDYPQIYQALTNVFMELPDDVFHALTDPKRPVIFVSNITTGIARYAHATEFIKTKKSTFAQGFYLITLADELNNTDDVEAIEGIIFHELAHRYLEHLRRSQFSCEMEKEANGLVKKWGFEKKFLKAKEKFGSKKIGDSPCQDLSINNNPK